jgi:mono/diheme cytochrome c family protein
MNKKPTLRSLSLALALLAVPAIGFAADAKENWAQHCAKCHGADGAGQTTMGKKLKLKDYTDAKVQAGFKDEDLLKVTLEGKEKMPAFKEKISAAEAKALVGVIRSFKK